MTLAASSTFDAQLSRAETLHDLMVMWRLRLDPRQVPGLVRRHGNITQEEMAFVAGVTHSYYGRLERGKVDGGYSDEVLDAIAGALRLTTSERVALYALATGREPKPRPYAPAQLTAAVFAMLDIQPWPAFITNATFDVLACNTATWQWFPHLDREANIMRALFCLPECRINFPDWATVHAPRAIAQLRARLARMPNHEGLKHLIRDVLNASPEARHLWSTDPTVWMHDDGEQCALLMPGAPEPTTVEVITTTPLRNPDLRTTALIPLAGYIPDRPEPEYPAHL